MKTLELEVKGWVFISRFSSEFDVWGRGKERILYDAKREQIHMRYYSSDIVSKYIEKENNNEKIS